MLAKRLKQSIALTVALSAVAGSLASAQYYDPCNVCAQPVAQTCYQTVPVTEYRPEVRKVMKAVPETKYVDQTFTEYVPVTEQKTANVQTVNYQNVTECRQVSRDMGGWQTQYQPVPKMSACDYDKRPTFMGWLNRNAYSVRSAFTPNYRVTRSYQPNIVTQNIPVTRQVAVPSTRQVTYNVTRYEARQTTRKVAVQTTKYVEAEETVMTPRTVYRTVPTGTAITYGAVPYGVPTSRTALAPVPDPVSASGSDSYKRSDATREADSTDKNTPIKRSSYETAPTNTTDPFFSEDSRVAPVADPIATTASSSRPVPSAVRVSRGWRPTGSTNVAQSGPKLVAPKVASR